MRIEQAPVVSQTDCRGGYALLVLEAPEIAAAVRPGQFVHLKVPQLDGAVLRRPFSVYRADGNTIGLLYKRVGKGTHALARLPPVTTVSVIGPLGNGFAAPDPAAVPVIVAGGYGVAPLSFLARRHPADWTVFIGGAAVDDILCEEDFESLGCEIHVTTEDGSRGTPGLIPDALDPWLAGHRDAVIEFFACGPDGMLKAIGERAGRGGWRAWLSLDKHMGCGVGACLACVQKIRDADGRETWKRVCRDGPVFEAADVIWGGSHDD